MKSYLKNLGNVYSAFYKSISQYGWIVSGGCADNEMRPLVIQQNQAVRICLKNDLVGSSVSNIIKRCKFFLLITM